MSKLLVSFERQEPHPDDAPLLYARNKFTLNPSHPYALTFARLSFLLGLITSNIHLCTPLALQNPDNAPIILTSMQELYLDRLLALQFDESDNGGYARRWACYAEILGFWGVSGFWNWQFRKVEDDGDCGNDVVRRVRWQNTAVERARYEIAMLRFRILFHRGRQYLRGGQNLRRLQRRRVRKMEKVADRSRESYKEDLGTYPRAVEWAVCETPVKEQGSSGQDTITEEADADGDWNMVLNVDGMLWKWDSSCLKWIALEALNAEQDTSSGEIQNEGHDESEEVEDGWDWMENFLDPSVLSPRRIDSSAAVHEEEPGTSPGEVRSEGHDEVLEMTEDPNLTTHEQTLLEMFQRETFREPTTVGGDLFERWTGFSQHSNHQQPYDGIADPKPSNPSREQDTFEKLQKLILGPETTVDARLDGMRQLTAYKYTSEDRVKWTVDDWSSFRDFWASEPHSFERMFAEQDMMAAPDSTGESLLLELIEQRGLSAVLGGEKRIDSGVGLEDGGMELTPSTRMAEQLDKTAEKQLIEVIQQQGVRAVMVEPKPVKKVGWIMGRMVLYNPKEEELGDFCVKKIRHSTAREKSKQRAPPPISLASFTCHKSTAKPPVNTPDRPSQVRDESIQPPTPPIPIGPVPWTGQPRHLPPYQPRHLSLPTKLVEILNPSSRDDTQEELSINHSVVQDGGIDKASSRNASRDKPSTSNLILNPAPFALFHPDPPAWYSEWVNSRTYATAATEPAPAEAGKNSAMKKLGRRKKDAEHEPSALEQDQNNMIVDKQMVLDEKPGMPSVQSMFELFPLRASQASIGVAVEESDSRRDRGIAVDTEKRTAFPSPPLPPPPPETSRGSTRKSRGRGRGREGGRGVAYREREVRNQQQSAATRCQDIIPEPAIPPVASKQALVEAAGARLSVEEPERRMNDAEHEPTALEQSRNNECIIDQTAPNEEPGMTNEEHRSKLSQLDACRASLDVAVAYVNSRHDRERSGPNNRDQRRGRSRGRTFRERYPRKWQQIQAAAIEGQHIISNPGSSTQDTLMQMTEREPIEPGKKERLEAAKEQSDHPPSFSTDSGAEQLSRLASLGLEDYASDQSEEDADGEAPRACSDSNAYVKARSLITEELVRVPQSGVTPVQTWAQIVQRETPQEPTARVEAKVEDDPQVSTKTQEQPQRVTTEVPEIVSRPRGREGGRGNGRQRQPRQRQQPRAVHIEGQNIISKPDSLPSTQDILEENERRHICMYDLATTQGPDAIAELLARRAAIRDRLVWMSDRMADKGTTRDQRRRMVAVGWCRWFNWKDQGGTGSFSFDEKGSWVDFLNPGDFNSHLPLVQPASSAATAANAPIMSGNPATTSVFAVPPSAASTAFSSFMSEAELLRHMKRNRASAERKAKKKTAAKAETNTKDEMERPSTSSSRDKGKMKATDFRGVPISYAEGPDTTSENTATAIEVTELEEVERITDDAGQGTGSSPATAANAPIRPGNSGTLSSSYTSAVLPSTISIAASPDNWLIRLMRNISPSHHERSRPNARGRARQKAYANAEANTEDAIEKLSTSSSQDKSKMKATNFTGAPIPISYVTDEMKAVERNQIDELTELGGPEALMGDSMKVEDDARGNSQDTSLVPLTEENEHGTKEEPPLSPIRVLAEPRSRSDSMRRVIWGTNNPVAYEDFWNSTPKPPPEVQDARTEHDRTAEVPFGMIQIDGSLECIGEVEKTEDEARRMGQNEMFEPNAHQERRTVRADGTVKFIFQPMVRPPRWNIDVRRPVVSLGTLDMGPRTARELRQLRERDAKNARKARIASRSTRGEEGRHAVSQMLDFPAFSAFATAVPDEEKVEDDARRIGQEELFEVEEGPRTSVQLPPEPDSSCSSVDDTGTHLVGFSDNSELDNN